MKIIDLRSDTVTQPTDAMRQAMANAVVGDDVYQDDPTVNKLEEMAAALMGKEAALFVPTGTMGNQICILAHTQPGDEIITTPYAHVFHYEGGAPARLAHVSCALADHPSQTVEPQDILALLRPKDDPHFPETRLVCLENPLCNGNIVPLENMKSTAKAAREQGLAVHLDGARIFNAAHTLGVEPKELADCGDTVMFCVSKGLCAPVGSLICGSKEVIHRARRLRKLLGGGMRQAGVLAACGIVALEEMIERLKEDRDNAQYLARGIQAMEDFSAKEEEVSINMVFWKALHPAFSSAGFVSFMAEHGIKVYGILGDVYRFVTHHDVTREDIDVVLERMAEYNQTLGDF